MSFVLLIELGVARGGGVAAAACREGVGHHLLGAFATAKPLSDRRAHHLLASSECGSREDELQQDSFWLEPDSATRVADRRIRRPNPAGLGLGALG